MTKLKEWQVQAIIGASVVVLLAVLAAVMGELSSIRLLAVVVAGVLMITVAYFIDWSKPRFGRWIRRRYGVPEDWKPGDKINR